MPNYLDVDDDGDGVETVDELDDTDGDRTPDYLDESIGGEDGVFYSGGQASCSTSPSNGLRDPSRRLFDRQSTTKVPPVVRVR